MRNRNENNDLPWCIGLVALFIPIWIGLAPMWYGWYGKPENGLWMKTVYVLLDGNALVNLPLCVILAFVAYRCTIRIWHDYIFRWYRAVLIILGLVVLYCGSDVEYAKVVSFISYGQVFAFLLIVLLCVILVKGVCKLVSVAQKKYCEKKIEETERNQRGFTADTVRDDCIPESLKKYAGEIVERLLVTNIKNQSYALGVTGEWGVGKTTFLRELKKTIGNRADIVEFNPWMCRTPEQVTNDFFASLRHQLSDKYSTLSKSIKEYAKYVNNVKLVSHPLFSMEALISGTKESLFERKNTLSKKFSRLPKPIIVLIDDLDRLERDEVFEVLRLIRNTADLSNLIYMVAYDKEYVTSVLKEKEIKDATAYLEKIFPVEIHLPKVEEHLVWNTLYEEIREQSSIENNFVKLLFDRFVTDDKELILNVLTNYRRTKRFARLYMLNIAYLNNQSQNELKFIDVFWLELLQMYDKTTYDVLATEPGVILFNDGGRYRIKDGILRTKVHENNKYEGESFWREETPNILGKMFGRYINTHTQSICFTENYDKYFTLSVSPFRLSVKEMNRLFEPESKAEDIVEKWLNEGKYFNSIAYQFKQVGVNNLNDVQLRSYLRGLLYFNMKQLHYRPVYTWDVKEALLAERYSNGTAQKAHGIVMGWFDEMMNDDNLLPALSNLLHRLYNTEIMGLDGTIERQTPLLISNDEIEILLVQVIKAYLDNHEELSALDVMNEKGVLSYMFKNCCVVVKDAMVRMNYCLYKQVAFEIVTNHFSSKSEKPTRLEYERAIGAMFREEVPVFDNPTDEDTYWAFVQDSYENNMQAYFGSDYNKKDVGPLTKFAQQCFVEDEKMKI